MDFFDNSSPLAGEGWVRGALAFLLVLSACIPQPVEAKRLHHEAVYQKYWCDKMGGQTEVVLEDKSRVDCLLPDRAVEVDFANKYREAFTQSQEYALATDRLPGILLILESEKDEKYLARLRALIRARFLDIKIWIIWPEDLQ